MFASNESSLSSDLQDNYTLKVDVYSYAMTIYEIASGQKPWNDIKDSNDIVELVLDGKRPNIVESIPDRIAELIEVCWSQKPADRPSFIDVLNILVHISPK